MMYNYYEGFNKIKKLPYKHSDKKGSATFIKYYFKFVPNLEL